MFKSTMSFIGFTPQFRHSVIPMATLGNVAIVAQENGYGQTNFAKPRLPDARIWLYPCAP
jgi:hypothetical protein